MKTSLLITGLAALLAASSTAATPKAKQLAQVPPAIRRAAEALVGDGKLLELERAIEHGHVVFEGEMRRDGVVRNFTLAADGMLIARQIFEMELPTPVAETLRSQLAGSQLGDIYWTNDDGDPAYYAELIRDGAKRSLTIAPDGWLAAREIVLAELPTAVRQAVQAALKDAKPVSIERANDGGEVTFDVTVEVASRSRTLVFNEQGAQVATEVAFVDLPPAVQKAIQPRLAGARLVHTFKAEEDGETYFEATFVKGGVKHAATTLGNGTLVSVQLPLTEAPPTVQTSIREQNAFVVRVKQVFVDGESYFEVLLRSRGKGVLLEFKADGKAN